MEIRKGAKAAMVVVLLPVFVAVVGGYIVERIKGTPPGDIAAALWHPFGVVIGGTAAWLEAPAQLTRITASLSLLIFAYVVFSVLKLARRLDRIESRVFYNSLGDLTEQVTQLQELRRQVKDTRTPEEEPRSIEDFEPSRIQMIAAKALIDRYPTRLQLADLAAAMQQVLGGVVPTPVAPRGEIARQMEDMQQKGIATIDDPNSVMAYYGLTRQGRDFMLDKLRRPSSGARAQPPVDPRHSALRDEGQS